jgi:hypothetical protein
MKALNDYKGAPGVVIFINRSQESLGSGDYRLNTASSPPIVTIDGGSKKWYGKIDAQRPFLRVERGMTVTLRNLTITGFNNNFYPLIQVDEGGTLNLENVILQGNTNNAVAYPDLGMYQTGGIDIAGTVVMDDGAISTNTAGTVTAGTVGGVYIHQAGRFTITAGTINENTGGETGGVYIEAGGEFIMAGSASVIKNKQNGSFSGTGGVYVKGGGIFTMNGGTIAGNTSVGSNQGVGVNGESYFTMNKDAVVHTDNYIGTGISINVGESLTQNPAANFEAKEPVVENDYRIYLIGNIGECHMKFQINGGIERNGKPVIMSNGRRQQ